ncbi:MAG: hypothetical protein QM705_10705 [Ancrocorticia sp.]
MFWFSGGELLVILVVAALVMGPKNVAQALHGLRKLLDMVRAWSAKLRQETAFDLSSLGINPADVEKLKNLDLSQYDPRQMVREAVQEEMNAWIAATNGAAAAGKATAAGAAAAMPNYLATPTASLPGQEALPAGQPGRAETGGGASSSDIIRDDDGPLDLHTILNRPDLGGSR